MSLLRMPETRGPSAQDGAAIVYLDCPRCGRRLRVGAGRGLVECPDCAHRFFALDSGQLHCPRCGCAVTAAEGARRVTCSQCEHSVYVAGGAAVPAILAADVTPTFTAAEPEDGADEHAETSVATSVLRRMRQRASASRDDFAGRYDIVEALGKGGMGAIYKVWQRKPPRLVVLKVMLHGRFASVRYRQRFEREVQAVARLRHPGIVSVYEYGEVNDQPYFTMEYVEGWNIRDHVERRGLDKREICRLVASVSRAVAYAHSQGVIHRDVKPTNILVDHQGHARLLDFGLARLDGGAETDDLDMTEAGEVMGTPSYMSPEQALGRTGEVDERSDIYSIGVLLYQLLAGALPYKVDRRKPLEALRLVRDYIPRRPSALNPRLDADLDSIVLKCLEKERETRYQSADALADDLERYLRGDTVEARPLTTAYYIRKLIARHRTAILLGLLLALGVAGVTTAFTWNLSAVQDRAGAAAAEALARAERAERERREMMEFVAELGGIRPRIDALTAIGRWADALRLSLFAEQNLPGEDGVRGLAGEVRQAAAAAIAQDLLQVCALADAGEFAGAADLLASQREVADAVGLAELAEGGLPAAGGLPRDCRHVLRALAGMSAEAAALGEFAARFPDGPRRKQVAAALAGLPGPK